MARYARIKSTGSNVPERIIPTSYFLEQELYYKGNRVYKSEEDILKATGGILERRWCAPDEDLVALATPALRTALEDSPEKIDLLLLGHNTNMPVPPVAALVQGQAEYPNALAFDAFTDGNGFDIETTAQAFLATGKYRSLVTSQSLDYSEIRSPESIDRAHFRKVARLWTAEGPAGEPPWQDEATCESVDGVMVEHRHTNGTVSQARLLAQVCDLGDIPTADITAGCPAFVVSLNIAARLIEAGKADRIAVVGADRLTEFADPNHLDITLYGDSAGAVIVEASETPGVIDSQFVTIGKEWNILRMGEGVIRKDREWLVMEGHEVFRRARLLPEIVTPLVKRNGYSISDVKAFFIHQMNGRILTFAAKRLFGEEDAERLLDEKIPWSLDKFGNSAAGTIPLTFDMVLRNKLAMRDSGRPFDIHLGDDSLVVFASIGAGMILAASILRL